MIIFPIFQNSSVFLLFSLLKYYIYFKNTGCIWIAWTYVLEESELKGQKSVAVKHMGICKLCSHLTFNNH